MYKISEVALGCSGCIRRIGCLGCLGCAKLFSVVTNFFSVCDVVSSLFWVVLTVFGCFRFSYGQFFVLIVLDVRLFVTNCFRIFQVVFIIFAIVFREVLFAFCCFLLFSFVSLCLW